MRRVQFFFRTLGLLVMGTSMTSCATVFGGRKYTAVVNVQDHPEASIFFKGMKLGEGQATVKIPRAEANKVRFYVREEDCDEQVFQFSGRNVRGWGVASSVVSDLLLFPFIVNNIVDISTGAYFKPNPFEKGIRRFDSKTYQYTLDYSKCPVKVPKTPQVEPVPTSKNTATKSKKEKLLELNELFEEGLITEEEYKKAREKIIAE